MAETIKSVWNISKERNIKFRTAAFVKSIEHVAQYYELLGFTI